MMREELHEATAPDPPLIFCIFCLLLKKPSIDEVFHTLIASLTNSSNFCIVWRMNSDFYLQLPTFSNTLFNRFSIPFFIPFKYYFFIHSLFIIYSFLTTTYLPTFFYSIPDYYNRKKHLKDVQQPIRFDELLFMSQKKKKKKSWFRESIGDHFFFLSHSLLQRIFCSQLHHWRCSKTIFSKIVWLWVSRKCLCGKSFGFVFPKDARAAVAIAF